MSEMAELVAALTGVATAGGTAIAWLWRKVERTERELRRELAKCQEGRGVRLAVIELLWLELTRHEPDSPVLVRAKALLDSIRAEGDDTPDQG